MCIKNNCQSTKSIFLPSPQIFSQLKVNKQVRPLRWPPDPTSDTSFFTRRLVRNSTDKELTNRFRTPLNPPVNVPLTEFRSSSVSQALFFNSLWILARNRFDYSRVLVNYDVGLGPVYMDKSGPGHLRHPPTQANFTARLHGENVSRVMMSCPSQGTRRLGQ